MLRVPQSANPSVPHPARVLFPLVTPAMFALAAKRSLYTRNEVQIRIREKITPGKIHLLRRDGL
jgi:hypothetical protein